jgi:hypothetical protein
VVCSIYRFRWHHPPGDDWVLYVVDDLHRISRHGREWPILLDETLEPVDRDAEPVVATDEQLDRWAAAGERFIAAVREAAFRPRRGPLARRRTLWAAERRERAIRAALAAYQPVRDEVRPVWEESRAARLATEERERAERLAQLKCAEAAYRAWWGPREAASALAERKAWKLTDSGEITYRRGRGRSVYAVALVLAERGETPSWTRSALAVLPDDPEQWWARVERIARNRDALEIAARRCVTTVKRVLSALVEAGQPGIEQFSTSTGHLERGWQPTFDWSARRVPPPALEEPPPPPRFPHGRWSFPANYFGKFAEVAVLVPYEVQSCIAWSIDSPSDFHRPKYWDYTSVDTYIAMAFDDDVTYHQNGWPESSVSFHMADEATPAEFIPFVKATADVIVAGFEHLRDHIG